MAEGVHLRHRADFAGVAEVVDVFAAREAGAGCRLDRDDLIVGLTAEFFAHKRGNETAEVRSAARAADDDVGLDAVFVAGRLGLESDDGLVQKHLIEDRAELITVAGRGNSDFNRLGDSAAK